MAERLRYEAGEEIRAGDRVLMDEHQGVVEFVADDPNHSEFGWYARECGVGVMLNTADFGAIYTRADDNLRFVSRGEKEIQMSTSPAQTPYVEPWLRGTYPDVPAVGRAVLHALDLALDDITKWSDGLTDAEVHAQPLGLPSLAFHLRHIARSVDRILTYAEGGQLTGEQLAALKAEQTGNETLAELLGEVEASFSNADARVRTLAVADFNVFRGVGRKQLPTSIGGALIHVADHTQRHVGQVVTTAKVLKAQRS